MLETGEHSTGGDFICHEAFRNSAPRRHAPGGTAAPRPRLALPGAFTPPAASTRQAAAPHIGDFCCPKAALPARHELVSPGASKARRKQRIWSPQAPPKERRETSLYLEWKLQLPN